ncbi:MAG: hypothetical protein IPO40_05775 [Fibrobacteres bacterium]|nr:hypothetical protein [Fibrobacterota bacterium]
MSIGFSIAIILGWTLGATAPRIDTAHSLRLTIEAVDDRTNKPIQAQIRVDCKDVGETPLTLPNLPIHAKVSASFEESAWQRVALDSEAQRTHKVLLHFRSHNPDSIYLMVRGERVLRDDLVVRKALRSKERINEVIKGINEIGIRRKRECGRQANTRCKRELDSLRRQIRREEEKFHALSRRIDSLCFDCNDPQFGHREESRFLYRSMLIESSPRGSEPDPRRYEDALFNYAEMTYQGEIRALAAATETRQNWVDDDSCGPPPKEPDPNLKVRHVEGLAAHRAYLDSLPDGARRDIILYRMAFLHDLRGEADSGLVYLRELAARPPTSRWFSIAILLIGKHHFASARYDSAAAWITRSLDLASETSSLGGRENSLNLLDSCFLRQPDPLAAARRHFAQIGPRPYQDTVFQNLSIQPRKPQ